MYLSNIVLSVNNCRLRQYFETYATLVKHFKQCRKSPKTHPKLQQNHANVKRVPSKPILQKLSQCMLVHLLNGKVSVINLKKRVDVNAFIFINHFFASYINKYLVTFQSNQLWVLGIVCDYFFSIVYCLFSSWELNEMSSFPNIQPRPN